MRAWAKQAVGETETVFYPFSGPDFLYEDALFPESEKLFMCGLEPVGSVPDLAGIAARGELGNFLSNIRHALYTITGGSFFITAQMRTDLSSGPLNGVIPILLIFIERQGYKVSSVEYLTLDGTGTLTTARGLPNAVRIRYSGRTLVYCNYDVSNGGGLGFINLMRANRMGITYLKAASYLLHDAGFTRIRDAILDNSSKVVEDDSGIPLSAFDPKYWTVNPYGIYAGPISIFGGEYQSDLQALFRKVHPAPLSFGCGYQYNPAKSSLLVAVRKDD
jgi:hypothetical protein